jgi:hypothetical protein
MEKKIYTVVLQPGTDESAFLTTGPAADMQVHSNLNNFDSIISMKLTETEVESLKLSDLVVDVEEEFSVISTAYPVTPEYTRNTTLVTRSYPSTLTPGANYSGTNFWFTGGVDITASSGPVGFFTLSGEDASVSATIEQNYAGEYIDIVAIEAGTPSNTYDSYITHPDFLNENGSTSRFVKTNWTDYDNALVDNDQATNNTEFFDTHAIGVLSAAGGKFCGWCKTSSLRVLYLSNGVAAAYNGALNFHQNKSVNPATGRRNATIVTGAWGFVGIELTSAIWIERINTITAYDAAGNLTTISRPGGGWGSDLTPFTNNLLVPRVINDPADNTDKWMIAWGSSSRYTTMDTIMSNYNSAGGIYHFKSAGNNGDVKVKLNDPRYNTRITLDNSVSYVILDLNENEEYTFSNGTTGTGSVVYPLRPYDYGGGNDIVVAASQHSTINPLLDDYSNRGPVIDVAGAGALTWTSYPVSSYTDGSWGYFSGTSCAAPQAAGTAGIMICDFFIKRGEYPTIAQLKEIIAKNSQQALESENLIDFSNVPSPADFASSRLYSSSNVFRISNGDSQNGGTDLSDLFGTPTDRVYIPYSIRLGTGKYINSVSGPAYGRRPASGQTYPRRKIRVGV